MANILSDSLVLFNFHTSFSLISFIFNSKYQRLAFLLLLSHFFSAHSDPLSLNFIQIELVDSTRLVVFQVLSCERRLDSLYCPSSQQFRLQSWRMSRNISLHILLLIFRPSDFQLLVQQSYLICSQLESLAALPI